MLLGKGQYFVYLQELLGKTIMKQDEYCYPWAVPLQTYIISKHNGNTSAFARTQGVRQDQVARWLKRNCMVIDGVVYCEVSKANKSNKKQIKESK